VGMKFHEISKPETLEKRFIGKANKKAVSFMKTLLRMDPEEVGEMKCYLKRG
jgi:cyclin-dependent kinase-like